MHTVYVHTTPATVLQNDSLFSGREIVDRYVGTLWRAADCYGHAVNAPLKSKHTGCNVRGLLPVKSATCTLVVAFAKSEPFG